MIESEQRVILRGTLKQRVIKDLKLHGALESVTEKCPKCESQINLFTAGELQWSENADGSIHECK